ncbi:MAG: basic helix-loop-helix domain-containing protein [Bacteroidia bacterium]
MRNINNRYTIELMPPHKINSSSLLEDAVSYPNSEKAGVKTTTTKEIRIILPINQPIEATKDIKKGLYIGLLS